MGYVFLQGVREDEYVVKVDEDILINDVPKNVIDLGLEDRGSVSEAERHNQVFVVSPGCVEGCLPFISFLDSNQVISVAKIKFSEVLCSLERREGR